MCGIAGRVNFAKKELKPSQISAMVTAIAHRGPDDNGIYLSKDRSVGLGNTRLAILDLSKKGHQPMRYMDRYVITYNGEVYNFQEEREKLEKLGYTFRSDSDTEVVLALYAHYGVACLKYLRGMFAFCIYDEKEETLFLARDKIGKKPLKYYFENNSFIFASELKAILTQSDVARAIDWTAVNQFLTYTYVPAPKTGFTTIRKLEPGHYLFLDIKKKKFIKRKYWTPDFTDQWSLSEGEWKRRILDTLGEATRLRMISDVPVGAFLSGGVDSSAVVAMMARLSSKPVKTFTIKFLEKGLDESVHAKRVAKLYKTDHTELVARPMNASELLPMLAKAYEEPFADGSAVVTYMVSKLARRHVTVILNGDGGDENFAGYPRIFRYRRDLMFDKPLQLIRPIGLPLANILSPRIKKFLEKSKMPLSHRYVTYNFSHSTKDKWDLYQPWLRDLLSKDNSYDVMEKMFTKAKVDSKNDAALYADLAMYLPDDLLTKVDIASMAVSLEGRSPLLDHKVIELACKIPLQLKIKNGETKYIFKKALEGIVPHTNLYRPKMGFSIPYKQWFAGSLNSYAAKKLLGRSAKVREFLEAERIQEMLTSHSTKNDMGPRLWSILALEHWLEAYFN